MNVFNELKRRNVFRVAVAYVVISWLLIQVVGLAAESFEAPAWVMKMVITLMAIGFIPALFFSWAFELTSEGIKKETEIDRDESITNLTAKRLDIITIIVVVAVIGLLVIDRLVPKTTMTNTAITQTDKALDDSKADSTKVATNNSKAQKLISDNSIAVLPFTDLSQNGDQEYFSDGMAEEILNVLVQVDALKVASRTSAFQFKGRDIGIPEIAKQLKVRHVLEGSVRKSGNTIRITAQLIDAQTDKHLWSDTYDRPLTTDNIFAIQDEISNAIVKALSEKLVIKATPHISLKKTTNNLSAYELFLKARPMFHSRRRLDEADALLIQALILDPNYAQAWAVRAALQSLMHEYGFSDTSIALNDKNGIEYADRALSIDSNLALALAVKSKIKLNSTEFLRKKYDITQIINNYKKALQIEPHNPSTLNWIGLAYQFLSYHKQALEYFTLCVEYEPRYTPCLANSATTNQLLGNYEVAVNLYREGLSNGVLELSDAPFWALAQLNNELAFVSGLNAPYLFPRWHRNGELFQAYKNPSVDHSELVNAAYEYLSEKAKTVEFWPVILAPLGFHNPEGELFVDVFGGIQKDLNSIRIKTYIKKAGIYEYWQTYGYPPQCRAKDNDDFECDQISRLE